MNITYESIKPYILEENLDASKMHCKFQIDNKVFEATGGIRASTKKGAARITNQIKNTAIGRMRTVVMGVLRRAVGGGFAATVTSMAGNEVIRQQTEGVRFSAKEKEAGVIKAFESILSEVTYEGGKWRLATEFSEFEKIIRRSPLTKSYDKKILARMLVEMAKADGSVSKEEKEFFEDFLTDETGNLGSLMRAPSVSIVECEEISADAKENVFMITAAVALTDDEFSDEEQLKLDDYAQMLGFTDKKKSDLLRYAQDYTIETAVKSRGNMSRDEIYSFADSIGMDRSEAERAAIRLEKRLG
jgi:tellurite resistance protein